MRLKGLGVSADRFSRFVTMTKGKLIHSFLIQLMFTTMLLAQPTSELAMLDKLSYQAPAESLDKIRQQQAVISDENTLFWLRVLEAKALYHLNKFSESQSILIGVESAFDEIENVQLKELTLRLMGQNFYRMGGFDQAMSHALKAQLIAEKHGLMLENAQITNMIAAIHLRSGEFELALKFFEQALKSFESSDSLIDVAKVNNNLAALHIEIENFDLAKEYLNRALELAIELKRPTTLISALVNQIELNVMIGHFAAATTGYETCLSYANQENLRSFEVWCLEAGAEMFQRQGAYDKAIAVADKAYKMSGEQNLHQSQINLGKILVQLYTQTQQFKEALTVSSLNLTQVEAIKDEVLKLKLEEVSALNDVERTRSQLHFERQQNKLYLTNQRLTWIGLAVLIPSLLISLFLLRSKQRLVQALNLQQQQTENALQEMRTAKETNEKLAKIDALTGLFNRREMSRIMDLVSREYNPNTNNCVLMIDVDRFKRINDDYGHAVGDQVLIELSQALGDLMPDDAQCARWGGEEFLVLLPNCSSSQAKEIAEHFIQMIAQMEINTEQSVSITVSVGLKQFTQGLSMDAWIHQADQALYLSKNNGRNQLTVGV